MDRLSPTAAYARSAGLPARLGLVGDERLARLVATGTERAFVALYERYHQPLYRYCRSILRDECDAQDALQSTFAAAFTALTRGQRDAPLRPWLFRIAHNEAISVIRRRAAASELIEDLEPSTASAEEQAHERERLALLVADLLHLPDRQRGALVMRELSGLSHREIALALGTTVGAAKLAIFEARSALLEFAEGRAMDCEEIRRTISDGDRRALRGRRIRAHLRDCGACAAFAAAIPARTSDLHAIALPLAPLAAAGMLANLTAGGSAHAAAGGGGAGGVAGAVASKVAGAGLATKAIATAVVVTGAAAGVTGALSHPSHTRHRVAPARLSAPAIPATGRSGAAVGPGRGAHALVTPGAAGSAAARWPPAAAHARSASGRGANSGSEGAPVGSASGVDRAHNPAGLPATAGSAHRGDHGRPSSAGAQRGQAAARPSRGRSTAGQRGTERRSQGQGTSRVRAGAAPGDRRSATGSARAGSAGAGSGTSGRTSSGQTTGAGGGSAAGSPAAGGSGGAGGGGTVSTGDNAVAPSGANSAGSSDTNPAGPVNVPNALQSPSEAGS